MRIAAFDSGIGGLTAIAPLFSKFRDLEVCYLGDLANLPYGTKSPERIRKLTEENLGWLLENKGRERPFDLAVIACNTASAHALDVGVAVGKNFATPVIGVVDAGARAAVQTKVARITVLATGATVASRAYEKTLRSLGFAGTVEAKACPLFVPLVEDNLCTGPAVEDIVRRYLDNVLQPQDAVILGCTHYPFLAATFRKLYPDRLWIDAGAALLEDTTLQTAAQNAATKARPTRRHLELIFSDTTIDRGKAQAFLRRLQLEVDFSFELIAK